MNDFETTLSDWLRAALGNTVPEEVAAFCFNLSEPADLPEKFAVDLIGAPTFDPNDENWACSEAWWPDPRWLPIPTDWSGEEWSECLDRMTGLVKRLISTDDQGISQLTDREAVAVGFVGGDLKIVWQQD